jgi:hypothetical protein
METVSNSVQALPVVPVVPTIPVLADLKALPVVDSSAPNFAAFKLEDRISFVRKYDPTVQAITGMRHAVIRYRNVDKKVAEKVAQMVTVPQIGISDDHAVFASDEFKKIVVGLLEDEQDSMLRSFLDQNVSSISWDALEFDKVLASLTAVRVSNRLTKDQIEAWSKIAFVEVCNQRADQISEAKKYTSEQVAKQRAGTLTAYCNLAMKLAAPVPNIGQNEAIALKNLLLVSKLDDDLAKVLLAKLEAILNPKIVESNDL